MSLFDVLKYPINDLPTAEQIVALPGDIWIKWQTDRTRNQIYFSVDNVKLLRKIISEYNNESV